MIAGNRIQEFARTLLLLTIRVGNHARAQLILTRKTSNSNHGTPFSRLTVFFCTFFSLFALSGVHAEPEFRWNGFATLGVGQIDNDDVLSQGNIPYTTHSESFKEDTDTKFALQGTLQFNERLGATVQLISNADDDYKVEPEWAYLNFAATSNLNLRIGKLRRPLFVYSDFYDVGYSYKWSRPPATTYFEFGPFYRPIESLELYYEKSFEQWSYSGQVYYGSDSGRGTLFDQDLVYEETHAYGLALQMEKEDLSFRLGYHHSRFSLEIPRLTSALDALTSLGYPELARPISLDNKLATFLSVASFYTKDSWSFGTEIIQMVPQDSILPTVNAWYATAGKTFGKFSLHYTYGEQTAKNTKDPVTPITDAAGTLPTGTNDQITAATLNFIASGLQDTLDANESDRASNILGLRYELLESTALKLEYEHLKNRDTGDSGNVFSISLNVLF